MATNIGEAGDIERVANTIIGLWNNNFVSTDLKEKEYEGFTTPGTIYGVILKMREGKAGTKFTLEFEGNTGKIKTMRQKQFGDLK